MTNKNNKNTNKNSNNNNKNKDKNYNKDKINHNNKKNSRIKDKNTNKNNKNDNNNNKSNNDDDNINNTNENDNTNNDDIPTTTSSSNIYALVELISLKQQLQYLSLVLLKWIFQLLDFVNIDIGDDSFYVPKLTNPLVSSLVYLFVFFSFTHFTAVPIPTWRL